MAHYLVYDQGPLVMDRGDYFELPIFITRKDKYTTEFVPNQSGDQIGWEIIITSEDSEYVIPYVKRDTGYLIPIKKPYKLGNGDKLYVGVTEPHEPFEHSIIKKIYTKEDMKETGEIDFALDSQDTEFLVPGRYFVQAKLLDSEGRVETVVKKRALRIV